MSSNSDDKEGGRPPQPGVDGWVDGAHDRRPVVEDEPRGPEFDLGGPEERPLARRDSWEKWAEERDQEPVESPVQRGKPMAILSHMSVLFGVPVFLIPIIKRDNAFALHHAKSAMVIYLLFIAGLIASFATCGLALPFALLLYVPAIVGVVHAARGDRAGPWALGHLGERLLKHDVNADESTQHKQQRDPHEETGESRPNR
ncbi:MAG: hypothetical protein ACQEVA_12165 [Myxococcota bacterium]